MSSVTAQDDREQHTGAEGSIHKPGLNTTFFFVGDLSVHFGLFGPADALFVSF